MTSKHFKALADALARSRPKAAALLVQWELDRDVIINVCQACNASFNREKFINVCNS